MPHCILDYSSNVIDEPDWAATLAALHDALTATGEFDLADIKSRVVRHDVYLVADGAEDRAFVTLNVQMLSGRSDETKAAIAETALGILVAAFPRTLAELRASLTVQISDIHRASYRKKLSSPA